MPLLTFPARQSHPALTLVPLTLIVLLVHGYHPYAEDGGMYLTGVKLFLNPALYPHDRAFVEARRAYSLFDVILGGLTRLSHLPLEVVLLATHLLCIYLTLLAVSRLAAACFRARNAPIYAAAITAAAFTLPVAGTSLFFMEPYLTARSVSTPLCLLALSFLLRSGRSADRGPNSPAWEKTEMRDYTGCGVCLVIAAMFHIVMTLYAVSLLTMLLVGRIRSDRWRIKLRFGAIIVAVIICVVLERRAPHESAAAVAAAHTRTYWFLSQWHWFEWLGLFGPLALFAATLRYGRAHLTPAGAAMLRTTFWVGMPAICLSVVFARYDSTEFSIARLQPLRAFHMIYGILLVLGASMLSAYTDAPAAHWKAWPRIACVRVAQGALLASIAAVMFFVQRASFPASQHIEWPGQQPSNPYSQAFLWARDNTAPDALFAMDPNYITRNGEDAQNFRPIAERSVVSDYSKDGGVAAITPTLATIWQIGSSATHNLNGSSPAERAAKMRTLGVTWLVLLSTAQVNHKCSYKNAVVKVCAVE